MTLGESIIRWDDRVFSGIRGEWHWVVARERIRSLVELTVAHHVGQHICIAAFDSGPISPSTEELRLGWRRVDEAMVSPPLTSHLEIPCDDFDEWYVTPKSPASLIVADLYVNYLGFNPADPKQLAASQDSSCDRTKFDWLEPLQSAFWDNLDRVAPTPYVSSGDRDIVATKLPAFADRVLHAAIDQTRA